MYILQLMDNYCASFSALIIGLTEVTVMAWIYGVDRFLDDIKIMLGKVRLKGFSPNLHFPDQYFMTKILCQKFYHQNMSNFCKLLQDPFPRLAWRTLWSYITPIMICVSIQWSDDPWKMYLFYEITPNWIFDWFCAVHSRFLLDRYETNKLWRLCVPRMGNSPWMVLFTFFCLSDPCRGCVQSVHLWPSWYRCLGGENTIPKIIFMTIRSLIKISVLFFWGTVSKYLKNLLRDNLLMFPFFHRKFEFWHNQPLNGVLSYKFTGWRHYLRAIQIHKCLWRLNMMLT